MKTLQKATAVLLFVAFSLAGRGAENPSPTIDVILTNIIAHAKLEAEKDRVFNQLYGYTREKVTEYRNNSGALKKREEKNNVHEPTPATNAPPALAETNSAPQKDDDDEPVTDTHSNVHGQAVKKSDLLLNEDLINRFQFTLAGKEEINGRPALMIDFVPADKNLPEHNIKDRFINKAAGRIWVDATDYALVKADLHLTKRVNVGFGLIGAVWKFNYAFDRSRTDDGYWFTHDVNWHLEGREVVVNRVVDYHETTTNLHKVFTSTSR